MSTDKHFIPCLILQPVVGIVASDSKLEGRFRRSNKVVVGHAYYVAYTTCRSLYGVVRVFADDRSYVPLSETNHQEDALQL